MDTVKFYFMGHHRWHDSESSNRLMLLHSP